MTEAIADCRRSGISLACADLRGALLTDDDLSGVNFRDADLTGAMLNRSNLSGAILANANLSGASLEGTNLTNASLRGANLTKAHLTNANLRRANLSNAILTKATMKGVKLDDADLAAIVAPRSILPEGELTVYKKLRDGSICKLRIPARAKRVGGVVGRKCRAEYARVISGGGICWRKYASLVYKRGKLVRPDKFDDNPLVECSNGIHFFVTRAEAVAYDWT